MTGDINAAIIANRTVLISEFGKTFDWSSQAGRHRDIDGRWLVVPASILILTDILPGRIHSFFDSMVDLPTVTF